MSVSTCVTLDSDTVRDVVMGSSARFLPISYTSALKPLEEIGFRYSSGRTPPFNWDAMDPFMLWSWSAGIPLQND